MTNQQAPEALRPIARYKIGYATDGWGMRSSTPSGIPDHAGAWVRYEDHIAALVEAQQPALSAAAELSDDLRDRLVAISAAIADQDDRAAQAMLREILAAPQPSPAAPVRGYPPLPDFDTVEQHIYGACRRYITQDMLEPIHNLIRDAIDADRAAQEGKSHDN